MAPIDKYLYEDKITAKKIIENPEFYNELEIALNYFYGLQISDRINYYRYSVVVDQFKNVSYEDIQAFIRFQDKDYYDYVKSKIKKVEKPKFRLLKK